MDDVHVTENKPLRSPWGLWTLWKNPTVTPDWAPLSYTMLWPQQLLWHNKVPMGYHLVSLFMHTITAFMAWMVLKRLDVPGAIVAALLFALHPLQIEPVAWIARQPMIWGAFWGMAFALIYLRFAKADNVQVDPSKIVRLPESPWLLYTFAMVTYLLAALSQPLLVCTLPLVVGMVAWWKRDDYNRHDAMALLPFVLIGVAAVAMHGWVEARRPGYEREFTGWESVFVPAKAVWFYLIKFLLPLKMSVAYQSWTISPRDVLLWMALISLVVIGVALWAKRRDVGRTPITAFGAYVLLLLPLVTPLNRAEMTTGFVADRFSYLATIVPAAVMMGIIGMLLARLPRQTRLWVGPVAGTTFALFLMIFARVSNAYTFESPLAMWQKAHESDDKNTAALINRGKAYREKKELDKAFADYEEVDRQTGGRNLDAKIAMGEIAETYDLKYATWHYQQALVAAPDRPEPYRKLGAVLVKQRQFPKAAEVYQQGLDRFPADADLNRLMGMAMALQNKRDEAVVWLKKAIDLNPQFVQARVDYAKVLEVNQKYMEALEQYNEAIKIDPKNYEAFMGAGGMLLRGNAFEQAYNCFRNALYFRPEDPEACFGAGFAAAKHAQVYWYKGDLALAQAKIKEATAFLKRASEMKKDSKLVRDALEQATTLSADIEKGLPKNRPTTSRTTQPTTQP